MRVALAHDDRPMNLRWVHVTAFAVVIVCWLVFFGLFMFRKRSPGAPTTRRERGSVVGIVVQGVAYAAIWMIERPHFTPIVPLPGLLQVVPALAAVALSIFSVWLTMAAVGTLGKEWSYEARLVEGHRLVTQGPYAVVRHPIYSAMLGKLVATALVISHWIGLVAGVVFFAIGTSIRVREEEKLLRSQFGAEYEAYARRVPAILPWPRLG
jgi:protein-S-isoprenylcysteine O-methyltransferase Ste14